MIQKRIIPILIVVALLFSFLLSVLFIQGFQENTRIINHTGMIQSAVQKLIKQELNGQPNDALITKIEGILSEMATDNGANDFSRIQDNNFQILMRQMQAQWNEMKAEILHVRQGADGTKLYKMSENYYELVDNTIAIAEIYSVHRVHKAEQILMVLCAVFLLLSSLLIWLRFVQGKRQQALNEREQANQVKSENLKRMSDDLRAPMDEISELMYISDLENYDLLFLNEALRNTFGVTELKNQKCYQILQGKEEPCSFCTTAFLKPGENYTWEYTNPLTQRHYLLKDRLIQWEGRPARLEIAFDITETEAEKQALKNTLDAEQAIVECIRTLYQEHNLEQSISKVFTYLGHFLSADLIYLSTIREGKWHNDFQWYNENVVVEKDILQEISETFINSWSSVFHQQQSIIIEDIDDLRENKPEEYELLHGQKIQSFCGST